MHKLKPYKCSICGADVSDLPMPVLKHQMSHVRRRSFARAQPERSELGDTNDGKQNRHDADRS